MREYQVSKEEMKEIGKELRGIRVRLGISQTRMAKHIGVHLTTLNRWECGSTIPHQDIYDIKQMYQNFSLIRRKRG